MVLFKVGSLCIYEECTIQQRPEKISKLSGYICKAPTGQTVLSLQVLGVEGEWKWGKGEGRWPGRVLRQLLAQCSFPLNIYLVGALQSWRLFTLGPCMEGRIKWCKGPICSHSLERAVVFTHIRQQHITELRQREALVLRDSSSMAELNAFINHRNQTSY